ncbi:MAG: recombinase family protein [Dehalococcoidia bacterium]
MRAAREGGPVGEIALAYVRPIEEIEPPLDATIQRTAVRACARGEGLGTPEIFEEASPDGHLALLHLLNDLAGFAGRDDAPPVVVATLAVLGDTALLRARRLLLIESRARQVLFADGRTPEVALAVEWADRPDEERRRERARESMRAKALRGLVLGRPPYGYLVQERALVPHPRESQVVKQMFRAYVDEGEGLRRIAARLNRDGIRTRLGRAWTPGAVRTVLKNPAYTGLYRRLGVVVPSSHPAIIDRATFNATQRRMGERRTSRSEQERHEYPLHGLLRCGRCGSTMIGERRQTRSGIAVSYRCENATARGTCRARGVRSEVLEAAIREELSRSDNHYPVAVRPADTPDRDARRQRLERRLSEGIERWVAGEWRYTELVSRMTRVVRALNELDQPLEEAPTDSEGARRRLLADWDALDPHDRGELLHAAVAEAVVEGKQVRVTRRR